MDGKPNISDRIAEAYYGNRAFGDNKKYVERVNWVCSQVKGENVLDVGCSQGIAPILLGREGIKVLGIDVDEKSIAYAKDFFSDEKETTLDNVRFECGNFMNIDFGESKYDTVICTEVLEHLTVPERFVNKINKLLKENGTAIFTVPFGINDFFDHKKTYYIYDLIEVISPYLYIKEIQFLGHWIGVICSKENEVKNEIDYKFLLKEVEKSFLTFENEYINKLTLLNEKHKALEEKYNLLNKKNNEKHNEYISLEKKYRNLDETVKIKKDEFNELSKKLTEKNVEDMKKITKLEKELDTSINYEKEYILDIKRLNTDYKNIHIRYTNLEKSKLGKIQVWYWNFRRRGKNWIYKKLKKGK